MKRLTAIVMALVMTGTSTLVLADRGRHDGDRYGGGRHGGNYGHYDKHGGKHHWKHRGPPVKVVHYYPSYPRYRYKSRVYYGYDPYLPLGAALVGTAIGYSLSQSGSDCYGNCTTTVTQTTSSNVSGCYRIERYPDGSERRVELPMSQCY